MTRELPKPWQLHCEPFTCWSDPNLLRQRVWRATETEATARVRSPCACNASESDHESKEHLVVQWFEVANSPFKTPCKYITYIIIYILCTCLVNVIQCPRLKRLVVERLNLSAMLRQVHLNLLQDVVLLCSGITKWFRISLSTPLPHHSSANIWQIWQTFASSQFYPNLIVA